MSEEAAEERKKFRDLWNINGWMDGNPNVPSHICEFSGCGKPFFTAQDLKKHAIEAQVMWIMREMGVSPLPSLINFPHFSTLLTSISTRAKRAGKAPNELTNPRNTH